MHRSLSILEVLLAILSACDNCTLCTLARTCRSFEDPALDLLWQHQTSFPTLVKTMPTDLWEERQSALGENGDKWRRGFIKDVYFRRSPIPTDFVVFNKYARRMTYVVVTHYDAIMSLEAIKILSQHISSRPILPNLRKLTAQPCSAYMDEQSCFTALTLLLGPKIQVLQLDFFSDLGPKLLIPFIQSVKTLCPSLRTLSLYRFHLRELVLAVSDLICHFDKFEGLDVFGPLTTRALSHIATISTLRHLRLGHLKMEHIDPPSGPGLAHLSTLVLETTTDVMVFSNFISLIGSIHLRELVLMIHRSSPSMQWQQCFQTLSCYYSTLETFELTVLQSDAVTVGYVLGFATLEPLLTLRHLRVLSVGFGPFNLTDDELEQMALAWPHLQDLGIETGSQRAAVASTSRVSLMGLVPLLKHCPDLRRFDLPIDTTVVDLHAVDNPGGVVSNHDITTMSVGHSAIDNPLVVAAFLSYILPNIQTINSWDSIYDVHGHRYRWNQVPRLMSSIRAIGVRPITIFQPALLEASVHAR